MQRQLLATTHVPSNLALISGQATGVVSQQWSAFKVFHANEALLPAEMMYERVTLTKRP